LTDLHIHLLASHALPDRRHRGIADGDGSGTLGLHRHHARLARWGEAGGRHKESFLGGRGLWAAGCGRREEEAGEGAEEGGQGGQGGDALGGQGSEGSVEEGEGAWEQGQAEGVLDLMGGGGSR
jgi:hypothetical protein